MSLEDATDLQIALVGVYRAVHDACHQLLRGGHCVCSLFCESLLPTVYPHGVRNHNGRIISVTAIFRQLSMGDRSPATIRCLVLAAKSFPHLCETTNFWFGKEVDVLVMAEESIHVIRVR